MAKRVNQSSGGDALLSTIEAVHAVGLQADLWPDAMRAVTRLFGAVGSTLEIFNKQPMTLRELHMVGIPNGAETPYVEYFAEHNPRASYAMRHLSERILFDHRLIDEREMDRDAYYVEYLAPIDLRYFMTGQILDTRDLHGVISIQRSKRQGHVEERDVRVMQRLLPHLQQAYDVTMRLQAAAEVRELSEHALDRLADGVALVGPDGGVIYANSALQDMSRRNDGVRIACGRLEFAATDGARRFALAMQAVSEQARDSAQPGDAADFIARRPSGAPGYFVAVRPVVRSDVLGARHGRAAVIVFVRDPLRDHAAAVGMLRAFFGLTEAEASVARALQSGTSLVDYAREHRISVNTVYTHLRRIKEKTYCRRQAELIRKLNDIDLPLRDGRP